jgi:hypothetical protein
MSLPRIIAGWENCGSFYVVSEDGTCFVKHGMYDNPWELYDHVYLGRFGIDGKIRWPYRHSLQGALEEE